MQDKQYTTKKKLIIEYREENGKVVEKKCIGCKTWYVLDHFPFLRGSFADKHNQCKTCEANRAKKTRRSKGILSKRPEFLTELGMSWRRCSKCEQFKHLDEFNKNISGFAEHDSECRVCKNQRSELERRNKGIQPPRQVPVLLNELGQPTHRECSRCQKMLLLDEFHKHNGGTAFLNRHPYCKSCSSERHLMHKYGMTSEDKALIHQKQNGSCAICQECIALGDIHVDHCHASGRVRGLLCGACNKAIGLLKDDPKRCIVMAEYLNESIRNT